VVDDELHLGIAIDARASVQVAPAQRDLG